MARASTSSRRAAKSPEPTRVPKSARGDSRARPVEAASKEQLDALNAALTGTARQVRGHGLFERLGSMAKVPIRPHLYLIFAKIAEVQPVRLADLARALEVDRSTISRQVSELVGGGFVTRVPDPTDGRSHFVALSHRGAKAQAAIVGAWRSVLDEATEEWTFEERRSFATLLRRLTSAIEGITAR